MQVDREATPTDLGRTISILWRQKFILIAAVLLAIIISVGLNLRSPTIYEASSRVRLSSPVEMAGLDLGAANVNATPEREMATAVDLASSPAVASRVVEALGPDAAFLTDVGASPVGETTSLRLTAQASTADVAKRASDALADAYVEQRRTENVAVLEAKAAELQSVAASSADDLQVLDTQITELNSKIADLTPAFGVNPSPEARAAIATLTARRDSLTVQRNNLVETTQDLSTQIHALEVAAEGSATGAAVVALASVPQSPISPTPLRDAIVAAAMGLVLGLAVAFGREALDDRIRTSDDLDRLDLGVPILARIPRLARRWRAPGVLPTRDAPRSAAAEAYRSLRTSLELLDDDRSQRVILVTSSDPDEGKTTTAANLAVSLARAGARVVLVDCDLRAPGLDAMMGAPRGEGLTSVLSGRVGLADALQSIGIEVGGSLVYLPSGPVPAAPGELLTSDRLEAVIDRLAQSADYVVLDSPPLRPVSDALLLSRYVDTLLFTIRADRTRRKHILETWSSLVQASAVPTGIVFNDVPMSSRAYANNRYYSDEGAPPTSEVAAANGHDLDGRVETGSLAHLFQPGMAVESEMAHAAQSTNGHPADPPPPSEAGWGRKWARRR